MRASTTKAGLLLICFIIGSINFAEAQQPKKMARIGFLSPYSGSAAIAGIGIGAFKEGLRELGWIEGEHVEFVYRYGEGQRHKYSEFATELVRLKVDVIVAGPGNGAPSEVKRATTTTPIVMVSVIDPVSNGLVASLARPEANVTGLTFEVTREQAGKNLEILKEAVPQVSRVAILRNPNVSTHVLYSKQAERVAKILGVTIQFADMQAATAKNLEDGLGAVVHERVSALLVTPHPFFIDRRQQIINFAARHKLPAIYSSSGFVTDGGLMSYGPNGPDQWRRAASYVDRILKGAKPADLPVEQPKKFELVLNLKAAKEIGLAIPPSVLSRADKVIK
jgi:putative ABC transport system substrate-binding protein